MHRNKAVFGEDVEVFRPERWLLDDGQGEGQGKGESEETIALRNRTLLHFGSGSHTCLGKNVSFLEMFKLVPSFLRVFEVRFFFPFFFSFFFLDDESLVRSVLLFLQVG